MKSIALLLSVTMALSGCCSFSKESRQQRTYSKYIRKSSVARAKQQSRLRPSKAEMPAQPIPSEPVESTETSPQSMPSEGSGE
ncbi:MAG: hypothetical protein H0U88_09145 [Chthoniobacterales bacterium]|nr:hypothetical protein [Chthoniobacterales bacterium]MDQ3120154.1 hypothetical protein [Verrucomicrobiota bacterium]